MLYWLHIKIKDRFIQNILSVYRCIVDIPDSEFQRISAGEFSFDKRSISFVFYKKEYMRDFLHTLFFGFWTVIMSVSGVPLIYSQKKGDMYEQQVEQKNNRNSGK